MGEVTDRKVILQVDFSKKFVIRHQDVIQADHWSGVPVTVYTCTAVAWMACPNSNPSLGIAKQTASISMVIVGDYKWHDKYVSLFNDTIIKYIKENHAPNAEVFGIYSDGALQHFKQKFTLVNATLQQSVRLNWHFLLLLMGREQLMVSEVPSSVQYTTLSWLASMSQTMLNSLQNVHKFVPLEFIRCIFHQQKLNL